jgi:DegV family protein with EDD domain
MVKRTALIVCGNSGVDYMTLDYPVHVFRSILNLDGKEYEDFVDITAEVFYDTIVKQPDIDVSTSQTSTGKMAEVYQQLKNEGYQDAIVITISSKLSGTYQGAILAKEMVEDFPIYVVDSRSVSYGEAYLVLEAIQDIQKGVQTEKIVKKLEQIKANTTIYVLVDTLKYLVKNGRLSGVSGMLGSLLKIKPLLRLKSDGALTPFEKIRTTSKARERLLEVIKQDINGKKVKVFIVFTNNQDQAQQMKVEILAIHPRLDIDVVPLTPVVGAHAGPGTLAVGYIELT